MDFTTGFYLLIFILIATYVLRNHRQKRNLELKAILAIKQSEANLKDVLWGSGDELWRWNLSTNLISRTSIDIHSASNEEKVISRAELLASIHPDDRALVRDMIERHISGKQSYYEAQFRLLNSEHNSWQWTLSRGRIVERDSQGKPLLMAGTSKDINEIKTKHIINVIFTTSHQITNLERSSPFHSYNFYILVRSPFQFHEHL